MSKKFIVCDEETENFVVGEFATKKEAQEAIEEEEKEDKKENFFKPNFYKIIIKE